MTPKGDGHTLGWAGTVINHPTDLQATRGGVAMTLAEHPDWHFLCVGGAEHLEEVRKGLGLPEVPEATPWRPLELHPFLVSAIDVGIVPLADLVFNYAKSWLKGIEYAALGIPFVASDMPESPKRLARALRPRSHRAAQVQGLAPSCLNAILTTEDRAPYQDFARAQVRQYLTISRNAWRWHEVWESLRCPRPEAVPEEKERRVR